MEHPLIPLTVFPSKIARIIEDTHESMRFPRNYIASSLIMALSVAIGNSHELTIPNGKKSKALNPHLSSSHLTPYTIEIWS